MGSQILAVGGVRMFRYALGTLLLLAGTALLVAKGLVWLDLEPRLLRALQGGALCALGTALGAVPVLVIRKMPIAVSDSLLGFGAGVGAYSGTKAALIAMARCLAMEVCKRGIRVNCLSPGLANTPLLALARQRTASIDEQLNHNPLGMGEPEDIANATIFMLSGASRWFTGSTLVMDGGVTIG